MLAFAMQKNGTLGTRTRVEKVEDWLEETVGVSHTSHPYLSCLFKISSSQGDPYAFSHPLHDRDGDADC